MFEFKKPLDDSISIGESSKMIAQFLIDVYLIFFFK
jgi:hypothetical protein